MRPIIVLVVLVMAALGAAFFRLSPSKPATPAQPVAQEPAAPLGPPKHEPMWSKDEPAPEDATIPVVAVRIDNPLDEEFEVEYRQFRAWPLWAYESTAVDMVSAKCRERLLTGTTRENWSSSSVSLQQTRPGYFSRVKYAIEICPAAYATAMERHGVVDARALRITPPSPEAFWPENWQIIHSRGGRTDRERLTIDVTNHAPGTIHVSIQAPPETEALLTSADIRGVDEVRYTPLAKKVVLTASMPGLEYEITSGVERAERAVARARDTGKEPVWPNGIGAPEDAHVTLFRARVFAAEEIGHKVHVAVTFTPWEPPEKPREPANYAPYAAGVTDMLGTLPVQSGMATDTRFTLVLTPAEYLQSQQRFGGPDLGMFLDSEDRLRTIKLHATGNLIVQWDDAEDLPLRIEFISEVGDRLRADLVARPPRERSWSAAPCGTSTAFAISICPRASS